MIEICVDTAYHDRQHGQYIITGWAVDKEEKTAPKIVLENLGSDIELTVINRPDVNQIFDLSPNESAGFQLKITTKEKKHHQIIFQSKNQTEEFIFDSGKKYPPFPGTESTSYRYLIKIRKALGYLKRNGLKKTIQRFRMESFSAPVLYQKWIQKNENWDIDEIKKEIDHFSYQPLISIIMPVYNVELKWLERCVASVENQFYSNWELCMADDASTDPKVKEALENYTKKDNRIKVVFREENGHISRASNSAIKIAKGEFIALLDNDDLLSPAALYEVVKVLNQDSNLDLIYSDEDKLDLNDTRSEPTFKPEWSPDLLLGTNYISHLGVYRKSIVDEIGGFRTGYEGSQDYDLVLRFTEQTTPEKIHHIPKVLYHWRMLPTSTAGDQSSKQYAFEAGLKALQDAIRRRGIKGTAKHGSGNGLYEVEYEVLDEELVSIIIPTKNNLKDIKRCLDSLTSLTNYSNYELIIADNGSQEEEVFTLYQEYQQKLKDRFKVLSLDMPFNYSKINNIAAKEAKGKYLLFLNNDIEIFRENWLTKMVSLAQFERIGCVGAKLLYENDTVQHGGIVLGLGGIAGHAHYGYPNGDYGYFGRLELNVNYLAVTAACLLMKKADFEAVDGFNEELIVAFNDVDLCLKVHEELGKDNIWLHDVQLYHYESQTRGYEDTRKKKQRFAQEEQYMDSQWHDLIVNDPFYSPNLTRTRADYSVRKN